MLCGLSCDHCNEQSFLKSHELLAWRERRGIWGWLLNSLRITFMHLLSPHPPFLAIMNSFYVFCKFNGREETEKFYQTPSSIFQTHLHMHTVSDGLAIFAHESCRISWHQVLPHSVCPAWPCYMFQIIDKAECGSGFSCKLGSISLAHTQEEWRI